MPKSRENSEWSMSHLVRVYLNYHTPLQPINKSSSAAIFYFRHSSSFRDATMRVGFLPDAAHTEKPSMNFEGMLRRRDLLCHVQVTESSSQGPRFSGSPPHEALGAGKISRGGSGSRHVEAGLVRKLRCENKGSNNDRSFQCSAKRAIRKASPCNEPSSMVVALLSPREAQANVHADPSSCHTGSDQDTSRTV